MPENHPPELPDDSTPEPFEALFGGPVPPQLRDMLESMGLGDLDPAQQHVLDVVSTGTHLFVDAPAGSDVTGTLAALVADAAASGRTVLYVPGHRRAAAALDGHDAVFVPAHDGGYALVGLRRAAPGLFADMAWGVPTVMARTRQRLAALGLRHAELAPLADIDEAADLVHLPPGWLA